MLAYVHQIFEGELMPIDVPHLPIDFMNDDHLHAAVQLDAMQTALTSYTENPWLLAQACREFLDHNRAHFAREEAAMKAAGFPPYPVHKHEHDQVLAWLENLTSALAEGIEPETARQTIKEEIPAWFLRHIQTMDSVTANWLAAQSPTSSMSI
jgi:hemerythrin